MKSRFSTVDIAAIVKEWKKFIGMRVVNVYDVDNKTYLIRLNRPDEKVVLLLESGIRLHSTDFDWPKNPAPSGFSMKLRKHIKNRRIESVNQLGMDRIVDFQFGSDEAAYHVILELYDRGNIVLTDYEYTILNILRPRTDQSQDVRLAVHESYPVTVKQHTRPTHDRIEEILSSGKDGDVIKKLLLPHLDYGPAIIEHVLQGVGFAENVKIGKGFNMEEDLRKVMIAMEEAEQLLIQLFTQPSKGYITQRKDKKPNPKSGESEDLLTYEEFHPIAYRQNSKKENIEFPSFDKACDEFFSKIESQKIDMKALQQERTALKKLEHVKKDNEKRIQGLQQEQETDAMKGQLIELNLPLVDQAILIVRNAIANQIDWNEIWNLIKEAQLLQDPVAIAIKAIKLDTNHITMLLSDPYVGSEDEDSEYKPMKSLRVDIDLSLSAYANSRKYFEKKKTAKKKEQKTADASSKAFKSAEKKAMKQLKEVATAVSINKTRKTYWDMKKGKTTTEISDEQKPNPQQTENTKQNKINKEEPQQPPKRGQKSKLKKIKEKYGDQDDEERQLRMGILQSDGQKKEPKRKGKKGRELQQKLNQQKRVGSGNPPPKPIIPDILDLESLNLKELPVIDPTKQKEENLSDDEKGDDDVPQQMGDLQVMESLTGLPAPEDELLYAVAMCAPYNCLSNYKYKVKVLPGNTKRGKATKTALNMFVTDKTAAGREKDLMKILKDVDISRNLPGKVKLQAPNITKRRK